MWGQAISNVGSLFNPKAEAQGASILAQTRYRNAQAAGQEAQNEALTYEALKKAGYSDIEIGALRAARDNSVSSIFKGINTNRGRVAVERGDLAAGAMLTGQASAMPELQKALVIKDYVTGADGNIDKGLAGLFLGGTKSIDGSVLTYDEKGMPAVGGITPVGQSLVDYNTQRAATVKATGDANAEYKGIQGDMLRDKTEAQIQRLRDLTDAQVDELVARGVDRKSLTEARKQAIALGASKAADPVKAARAAAGLSKDIDEIYSNDFAQLGDNKTWGLLDPTEKQSLRDRALYYVETKKMRLREAIEKSNADHNISGKASAGKQGKKGIVFSGPDGKVKIEGFKFPSAIADVVSDGSAPSATPPAPVITPGGTTPAAPSAPAAPAPAAAPATQAAPSVDVDGNTIPAGTPTVASEDDYKKLPSGTVYLAPDNKLRRKK